MTLPGRGQLGQLIAGKPSGSGWVNLIETLDAWEAEPEHWKLTNGVLRGESRGGPHHLAWTRKKYKDFELHAVLRLNGTGANSGVGIRLNPENPNTAPGYQVDMGPGYWGCLWEEGGAGMVQEFPQRLASRLVKHGDWNHYYIIADGPHIQAWLNGVKTIDVVHKTGFSEGALGLELCHGRKHTVLEVTTLAVREITD